VPAIEHVVVEFELSANRLVERGVCISVRQVSTFSSSIEKYSTNVMGAVAKWWKGASSDSWPPWSCFWEFRHSPTPVSGLYHPSRFDWSFVTARSLPVAYSTVTPSLPITHPNRFWCKRVPRMGGSTSDSRISRTRTRR